MLSEEEKAILIVGDFNLCYMTNENNQVSKELKHYGFKQLMNHATHIQGGHIDHVYWRDISKMWMPPCLERYSPYYSDHDASLVTLTGDWEFL